MRLAVLITYYNEGTLLRECLDSLLSQDGAPDEVIVYDDASAQPPDAFIPSGAMVRVVRGTRNLGPGAGRNVLLGESECDYVHFQDADDLFHPEWCREVRDAISRGQPDIVLTEIRSVRDGATVSDRVLGVEEMRTSKDLVRFGMRGSLLVPSTTFRRTLGRAVGGFRSREVLQQSEDFDFHIRLAAAARGVAVITRPLIVQRLRTGSHSADLELCWTSAVRAVELLTDSLPAEFHSDAADAAARFGSELYAIGSLARAREAFRLARRIGGARYLHRPRAYRTLATLVGPGATEWLSSAYRRAVSERLRRRFRG